MSVTYRIYRELGLVYVRYEGFVEFDATSDAVGRYIQDPDYRPGQKQFVDLSAATGYENDYAKLFALQAKKADAFLKGLQCLIVYYAPTETSNTIARLAARAWDETASVIARVIDNEAEALAVVGLSETSIEELTKRPV
ncbi:hypothetical protein [Pseudoruegeria sp. HB172150]|uniref:hypothetical protein n=1 Tax=Pseudoruegeria sp. HB172150 TaxID=2721164 RepID=UPI001556D9FE|nr:hypothetical protein [Pseudoruegeria sp. HB172150]